MTEKNKTPAIFVAGVCVKIARSNTDFPMSHFLSGLEMFAQKSFV